MIAGRSMHAMAVRARNVVQVTFCQALFVYPNLMPVVPISERRAHPREPANGLLVSVRRKGRLTKLQGIAIDFSRYGIGIVVDQPLPKDSTVYLTITGKSKHLDNVIGVVHNCTSISEGFRCGIQFRTTSELQDDKQSVELGLGELESEFSKAGTA